MMREQKRTIEAMANNLLKTHSDSISAPIDIEEVAKFAGLKVEYFPFPNEVSGLLKKEIGVVGINSNQNERRQRFTLAHEIGHYVLGHQIINTGDLVDDTNTDSSSGSEREANHFASVLLMPEKLVRDNVKAGIDIPKLADLFKVSDQAMTIRILELGLLK